MFVVTDLVGRSDWQIHDRLYHLLDKAYDGWNDPWLGLTRVCADADLCASDIPGMRAAQPQSIQRRHHAAAGDFAGGTPAV